MSQRQIYQLVIHMQELTFEQGYKIHDELVYHHYCILYSYPFQSVFLLNPNFVKVKYNNFISKCTHSNGNTGVLFHVYDYHVTLFVGYMNSVAR